MSDTTPACNASICCENRLATLEKRVSRIRTGLLIALGALLLLIGIAIGKGGDRREMRGRAAAMMMQRSDMRPPMGPPSDGPGPMMQGMSRGGPDRGPDGSRDGGPERGPKNGPGRPDRD
ncbi:MAG: hypothetical protein FJ292_08070 [Planctomycetes bacterium]|nr:hypothetical protein [Planctomycetota bacterium]